MDLLEDFINKKKAQKECFIELYNTLLKENKFLMFRYFLDKNLKCFYPEFSWNESLTGDIIEKNIKFGWVQIFDDTYKSFGVLDSNDYDQYANISLNEEQIKIASQNLNNYRETLLEDFFNDYKNLEFYQSISNFEELDYERVKKSSMRNMVTYFNTMTDLPIPKPLNLENWIEFYEKIILFQFSDFKLKKKTKKLLAFSKSINDNIIIEIEIDKKRIIDNFKYDHLELPLLRIYISSNKENKSQIFYYKPGIIETITNTTMEVEYIKKNVFFELSQYMLLHSEILRFITS